MVKLLKTLLAYKFKQSKPSQNNGGFTLIEVLVGMILALLVILPLLGFMVNMLQTDRQEQAKASSEQEIQTALNYISRDLEQAVYIYDGYGLSQIQDSLPNPANSEVNRQPILVFWKRQFVPDVIPTGGNQNQRDDGFTYALVAYYLETPKTCTQPSPWSCTAQITRLLIRGAITDRDGNSINDDRADADAGFKLFDPNTGLTSVEDIMNAWESDGTITKTPEVLIDYVDQTPVSAGTVVCPPIQRTNVPTGVTQLAYTASNYQQVPTPPNVKASGFFACVDVDKTSAQVFIRGNALARLQKKQNPPTYSANKAAYFPRASIQIKGRGLFTNKQGGE